MKALFETSKRLNSRAVSLTRCLILVLIGYSIDGLQFRELKAALKISDGKLIANINELLRMNYITKSECELDNKRLDIYELTEDGKKELEKISQWMELVSKAVKQIC